MKRILGTLVVALALVGCEQKQKAMENLAHDQEFMKAASAAANEVVRNATDCGVAKPLIPEAYRQLDDARARTQAVASHQILDALKTQVDRVAQLCP